jgi:folate-binding protein YgfZ
MSARHFTILSSRAVLEIGGADRKTFLQGLVSSDATKVSPARALHAAFLTAQGRFLHEFHMVELGEAILLDAEAARLDDLAKRLKLYKLRAKVTIAARPDLAAGAVWGEGAPAAFGLAAEEGAAKPEAGGVAFVDPRLAALGVRAILPRERFAEIACAAGCASAGAAAYDALRISLGAPDGSRDLPVEDALLLENGFDELHGVDWKKGCYVGQEVTARMKYRGLVKKRLVPVVIDGPVPAPGTPVTLDGQEAGEMRSSAGAMGLALLRLEALAKDAPLRAGDATLVPKKPAWAGF